MEAVLTGVAGQAGWVKGPTSVRPNFCSSGWLPALQDWAVVAFSVEHSKDHRLVVEDLIEHGMMKSPQVSPAPIAESNAVTKGLLGNDSSDALHFIDVVGSQSGLLRVIPAGRTLWFHI